MRLNWRRTLCFLGLASLVAAPALSASPSNPVRYQKRPGPGGDPVHILTVDPKDPRVDIFPALAPRGITLSTIAGSHKAYAAINAGYFDMANGDTVSFVRRKGQLIADPRKNKGLMNNKKLGPWLGKILDRAELRIFTGSNGLSLGVARHSEPAPTGRTIRDAIGAGPRLLPALTSVSEGFYAEGQGGRVIRDAIMANQPAARTAAGIKSDGSLVLVTTEAGYTLPGMQDLMRGLGCSEAINFDGGASVNMAIKLDNGRYHSPIPDRWVRSVLLITPK